MKNTQTYKVSSQGHIVDVELSITINESNVIGLQINSSVNESTIGTHSSRYNMNDHSITFFYQLANHMTHLRLTDFMTKEEIESSLGKAIGDLNAENEAYKIYNKIAKYFTRECSSILESLKSIKISKANHIEQDDFELIQELMDVHMKKLLND